MIYFEAKADRIGNGVDVGYDRKKYVKADFFFFSETEESPPFWKPCLTPRKEKMTEKGGCRE